MLEVRDLKKSFGSLPVLRGVSLKMEKGDVTAVIGPSGGGKTTLLRCMNFLESADSGTRTAARSSSTASPTISAAFPAATWPPCA